MRALLLEPDQAWLEQRRRWGADIRDEVWDGVLHVVPQPTITHQRFESALEAVLRQICTPQGIEALHNVGLHDPDNPDGNYRAPDISVVSSKDFLGDRGLNGHAELVIEIRSPNDESYEKMPFYARCKIPELWIAHPKTKLVEVYVLREGTYELQKPDAQGITHAPRFDLRLEMIADDAGEPKLRISWADGVAEI